jgi:hypothetical protein
MDGWQEWHGSSVATTTLCRLLQLLLLLLQEERVVRLHGELVLLHLLMLLNLLLQLLCLGDVLFGFVLLLLLRFGRK